MLCLLELKQLGDLPCHYQITFDAVGLGGGCWPGAGSFGFGLLLRPGVVVGAGVGGSWA